MRHAPTDAEMRSVRWQFRSNGSAWHGVMHLTSDVSNFDEGEVMAKSKFPITDTGATEPKPMSAAQHSHFSDIVDHTITNTIRAGHTGHALGDQGHKMPKSDAHLQKGAYLPQNTFSDSGSADANEDKQG
jgi:hypothetical protein